MTGMKKLALVALLVAACGGDDSKKIVLPDVQNSTCDLLAQTGCPSGQKCTWIVDATPPQSPQYVGHIGCAPAGTKGDAETCMYGMPGDTGYDDCQGGFVCSSYKPKADGTWPAGFCKQICDHQGGAPTCDADHVCVRYSGLFTTDSTKPAIAGVCDVACDVFNDNDYDGSGVDSMKGSAGLPIKCPLDTVGCYGFPSGGTVPVTGWSCTNDINYTKNQPTGFRHRFPCNASGGCADSMGNTYTNSCNQGYIPLFYESYAVQTAICTAVCKPLNCYNGMCGNQDINRPGAAGHACTDQDRMGFAAFQPTDHCRFEWSLEVDRMTGTFLRSPTSDTVGFCFDHAAFVYDSNNDGQFTVDDKPLPNCSELGLTGTHADGDLNTPATYWGASDVPLGCVNTATAGVTFQGKQLSEKQRELMMRVQTPRAPYSREIAAP